MNWYERNDDGSEVRQPEEKCPTPVPKCHRAGRPWGGWHDLYVREGEQEEQVMSLSSSSNWSSHLAPQFAHSHAELPETCTTLPGSH